MAKKPAPAKPKKDRPVEAVVPAKPKQKASAETSAPAKDKKKKPKKKANKK